MAEKEIKTGNEKKEKRERRGAFAKMASWFKSLRSEAKKVSWASAESVRKNTIIVIVCVVILAAVIGLLDYLLSGSIVGLHRLIWR